MPFTPPVITDPICTDSENVWQPMIEIASGTLDWVDVKLAVDMNPPTIQLHQFTNDNDRDIADFVLHFFLPSGESKTLTFQVE